jgi:hypothetical protein
MDVLNMPEMIDEIAMHLNIHSFNAFIRVFRRTIDQSKWQTHFTEKKINQDVVSYTLNGKYHSIYDLPAISHTWFKYGLMHRDGDLPMIIDVAKYNTVLDSQQ